MMVSKLSNQFHFYSQGFVQIQGSFFFYIVKILSCCQFLYPILITFFFLFVCLVHSRIILYLLLENKLYSIQRFLWSIFHSIFAIFLRLIKMFNPTRPGSRQINAIQFKMTTIFEPFNALVSCLIIFCFQILRIILKNWVGPCFTCVAALMQFQNPTRRIQYIDFAGITV